MSTNVTQKNSRLKRLSRSLNDLTL